MEKKEISMFTVLDSMPENTTAIFTSTKGGKSLGKKHNNNAIIEVVVDNDTFQDFAFQKTYSLPRLDSKRKFFMFLAIDADVYEAHRKLLHDKKG